MDSTLFLYDIDISNGRLEDLARLADQAKPFYNWVEQNAVALMPTVVTLNEFLLIASAAQIHDLIVRIYTAPPAQRPFLFDGVGRVYTHHKACYYFFAWLSRDAPQQRLNPIIQRMESPHSRQETEQQVLTSLIVAYRGILKTFSWDAIREIIIDRLEGSRRSLKGHEQEAYVRIAFITAFQTFYQHHGHYGRYSTVELSNQQQERYGETYDINITLTHQTTGETQSILIPIKTRETEGGGHAHLFTRDIRSAVQSAYAAQQDFLCVVIIAKNWAARERDVLANMIDYLAYFDSSPTHWKGFDEQSQLQLNDFIAQILSGSIHPKSKA